MTDNIDAFELLLEDLKDDDIENVIASMNRIGIVALSIGPKRTISQLLPFLSEYDENNEEALNIIALQLGEFYDYVGGNENIIKLLPILEKLACADETIIRESAILSLNKLHNLFTVEQLVSYSIPMVKRLVHGEWFTNRVSACGILSNIYKRVPNASKDELSLYYNMVIHDETPMVRKAAYIATPSLITLYRKELVTSDIIPAIKTLFADPADTTRVCAVDCVAALTSVYTGDEFTTAVLPLLESVVDDASWRVRAKLGSSFDKCMENVDKTACSQILVPMFAKLLKDVEAEVRQGAVQSLLNVAKLSPPAAYIQHVAVIFPITMADPINNVRIYLAENICEICPILGKDYTTSTLVPILLKLLKDEESEVRLNIINKINVLIPVIGHDQVAALFTPIIIELAKDTKWRVRLSIIEKVTFLAQQLGPQVFDKSLKEIVTIALSDAVHAVRTAAAEQVGEIVKVLGYDWCIKKLLPQIFGLYEQSHVASSFSQDALMEHCVPLLLKASKDPVSNVRFGVAKSFEQIIPNVNSSIVQTRIKPCLLELKNDSDPDVQYFASQALKKC